MEVELCSPMFRTHNYDAGNQSKSDMEALRPRRFNRKRHPTTQGLHVLRLSMQNLSQKQVLNSTGPVSQVLLSLQMAVGTVQTLGTLGDQKEITDGSPDLNKLKLGTTSYG